MNQKQSKPAGMESTVDRQYLRTVGLTPASFRDAPGLSNRAPKEWGDCWLVVAVTHWMVAGKSCEFRVLACGEPITEKVFDCSTDLTDLIERPYLPDLNAPGLWLVTVKIHEHEDRWEMFPQVARPLALWEAVGLLGLV